MNELDKMRSGDFYQLTAPEVEPYQEAGIIWNDEFRQGNNLDRPAPALEDAPGCFRGPGQLWDQLQLPKRAEYLYWPSLSGRWGLTIEDAGEVHICDYVTMGPIAC